MSWPMKGPSSWGPMTLHDWRMSGSFVPEVARLVGGTLTTTADMRGLDDTIDPGAEDGATCELLGSLGIECLDCPDDSGPFCLPIRALDMQSEPVDVTGVHPETGEPLTGLTEVTTQTLADWQAGGFCP